MAAVLLRRGPIVESRHRVHVAVVGSDGQLVARAGDPDLVTYMRSAAKPFQALPLVEDGVVDRFGIPPEELALCCASHSGEPPHVAGVLRLLDRCDVPESALACGPHFPRSESAALRLLRGGEEARPVHNNCSGKHAGMLALARHHGWPLEGYAEPEHPVQRRMAQEVARWAGTEPDRLRTGLDGCGVVCFGISLRQMARGFLKLCRAAERGDPGPRGVAEAMRTHPFMVGGTGRLCTRLMDATDGDVLAKVGAEGVYCAGDRRGGWGVALKIEDGSARAAGVALLHVLEAIGPGSGAIATGFAEDRRPIVRNTRGQEAATLEPAFDLVWTEPRTRILPETNPARPSEEPEVGGARPDGIR